jgi:hypothetical protein
VSKSKLCLTGREEQRDVNRKVLMQWVVHARHKLGIEWACVQDSTHSLTNGETVPSRTRLNSNCNRYLITASVTVLRIHGVIKHVTLKNACLRAYREAYLHSKVSTCSDIGSRCRQANIGVLGTNRCYHESGGNQRFDLEVHRSCGCIVIEELVRCRSLYTLSGCCIWWSQNQVRNIYRCDVSGPYKCIALQWGTLSGCSGFVLLILLAIRKEEQSTHGTSP